MTIVMNIMIFLNIIIIITTGIINILINFSICIVIANSTICLMTVMMNVHDEDGDNDAIDDSYFLSV